MLHLAKAEPRVFTYKTHPQSHKHTHEKITIPSNPPLRLGLQSPSKTVTAPQREPTVKNRGARDAGESTIFSGGVHGASARAPLSRIELQKRPLHKLRALPAHKIEHFRVPGEGARFIRKNNKYV